MYDEPRIQFYGDIDMGLIEAILSLCQNVFQNVGAFLCGDYIEIWAKTESHAQECGHWLMNELRRA
ncbi:unnamed protein product [marine sediment metagenome]|uniref:Uncharacterized protein n=1 Tax=marine sediment metagenome TaxID=412755 RepID=X1P9Z6_9ZZZZ